jgi:hypothetical protein
MSKQRVHASVTFGILILATGISGCGTLDDILEDWRTKHPPQPIACASTDACPADTVCTVESGVCNKPPGCSDGAICPAVCYGTCEKNPGQPPECRSDADCRAVSFTCTGCECLALAPTETAPTCPAPGVQCFADPCLNKAAVCDAGQCRIKVASCPAGTVQQPVCLQCGPAGGCAKTASCARSCKQNADCAADQTSCTNGLCQVVGCI